LIDEHIIKDIHILKLNILGCDNWSGLPTASRRAPELREEAAAVFGVLCVHGKEKNERNGKGLNQRSSR
jgi:hypothetical protein